MHSPEECAAFVGCDLRKRVGLQKHHGVFVCGKTVSEAFDLRENLWEVLVHGAYHTM